jgi:hypothetical protein
MGNEVHRSESDIIKNPENWEEMKKKYHEREEEKLKAVLERRKAESKEDLEKISSKAIVKRALRAAADHKPLKDRTILREAKSEEIHDLREKLNEEINSIGMRILKELPKEVPTLEEKVIGLRQLKGRISAVHKENVPTRGD